MSLHARLLPVLGLVFTAATAGCKPDKVNATVIHPARFESTSVARPRKFLRGKIDSIRWSGLGGRLGEPVRFVASNNRFFVQDDDAIDGFDASGKLLWKHDLKEERVNHVGGAATFGDTALFLASEQSAIVVIGPDGKTGPTLSLARFGHVDNFAALPDGRLVVVTDAPRMPVVVTDRNGKLLQRISFPWTGFDSTGYLARQGDAAADPHSNSWAFAFAFGDGFFGFRDTTASVIGHGVEPVALPSVISEQTGPQTATHLGRVTFASQSIAVSGDTLFDLFVGRDPALRYRVIDLYSLSTGAYLGSYRLPKSSISIALRGSTIYCLTPTGAMTVSLGRK
jgi:hypothetical protein